MNDLHRLPGSHRNEGPMDTLQHAILFVLRTCKKCGFDKSIDAFSFCGKKKTAIRYTCKKCMIGAGKIAQSTPEARKKQAEWRARPENKAAQAAFDAEPANKARKAELRKTEKRQTAAKAYADKPESKEKKKVAAAKPHRKEKMASYEASPGRIDRKSKYNAGPVARRASDEYRRAHPQQYVIYQANRAAKKRARGGALSQGLREKLFELQKGRCACCKEKLGSDFQMDHIIPIALGGWNIDSNIQLLRKTCNLKKHTKHPIDYMQGKGFLL